MPWQGANASILSPKSMVYGAHGQGGEVAVRLERARASAVNPDESAVDLL